MSRAPSSARASAGADAVHAPSTTLLAAAADAESSRVIGDEFDVVPARSTCSRQSSRRFPGLARAPPRVRARRRDASPPARLGAGRARDSHRERLRRDRRRRGRRGSPRRDWALALDPGSGGAVPRTPGGSLAHARGALGRPRASLGRARPIRRADVRVQARGRRAPSPPLGPARVGDAKARRVGGGLDLRRGRPSGRAHHPQGPRAPGARERSERDGVGVGVSSPPRTRTTPRRTIGAKETRAPARTAPRAKPTEPRDRSPGLGPRRPPSRTRPTRRRRRRSTEERSRTPSWTRACRSRCGRRSGSGAWSEKARARGSCRGRRSRTRRDARASAQTFREVLSKGRTSSTCSRSFT